MKSSTKDRLAFWGAAGAIGVGSGFIAWIYSAPWWIIAACTVGAPLLAAYAVLIFMYHMITNI